MCDEHTLAVFPNFVVYKASEGSTEYYQKPNELNIYRELGASYKRVEIVAFWKLKGEDAGFVSQAEKHVTFSPLGQWGYNMPRFKKFFAYARASLKICNIVLHSKLLYLYLPGANALLAGVFSIIFRKRYAVYVRNGLAHAGKFYEYLYRIVLSRAEFVICTGKGIEDDVRRSAARTYQVSPMMSFPLEQAENIEGKKPHATLQLLYVGTLNEGKGAFELLEIARDLNERDVDFKLNIIGNGSTEIYAELENRIKLYRIERSVDVSEFVSDPSELRLRYIESDMFLYPSNHNEGFPRVIYEAMLLGSLCVAYELTSYRNFLASHENCVLVPQGARQQASEEIIKILGNQDKYQRLISKAQRDVIDHLASIGNDSHADQIIKYFNDGS